MEGRKYRRRVINKRKMILRLFLLLFILILVAAGVMGAIYLIQRNAVPQVTLSLMPFTASDKHIYTGSGFLFLQGDSLNYEETATNNEKNNFSVKVNTTAFNLAASNSVFVLYNDASMKIVGEEFPVEISGTRLVTCGTSYAAALREDASGAESIQIFNKNGSTYDHISANNQYVTNYGFFHADSEYLYVVGLTLKSSTPLTTVTIYNISRKSTSGVLQVQSQLIEQMRFTKNSIYAVGTNQIIRYALSDNNESYRVTIYGWKAIDFDASTSNPAFLLRPRGGTALGTVKLIQASDNKVAATTERQMQLPAGSIDAFLMNGKLVAVTQYGYTTYDLTGKQLSEASFAAPVEEAWKLDGSALLLRAGNAMYVAKVG